MVGLSTALEMGNIAYLYICKVFTITAILLGLLARENRLLPRDRWDRGWTLWITRC